MRALARYFKIALPLCAFMLMPTLVVSQQAQAQLSKAAKAYFLKVDQVEVDAQTSRPMLMRGELARGINLRDANQAVGLMQKTSSLFGLDVARDDFSVTKATTDELGMSHARLQHRHRGVPVFGSEIILHADRSGTVRSMNGQLVDRLDISTTPAISAEQALQIALRQIGPAKYRWEDPAQEAMLQEVYGDPNRTWQPRPELVIAPYRGNFQGKDYRLAWMMRIAVDAPAPANWVYFIDARTGGVINLFNEMHSGTATTLYSGTLTIGTKFVSANKYEMENISRNIKTYTANGGVSLPGTIGTDSDDVWPQDAMNDAHWGAERAHQYYKVVHGRNGFNNAGALMSSTAHYGTNINNAMWTGAQVWYGDGDGTQTGPMTPLDICAHEWTHAVLQAEAVLNYQGESGALNEAWSDIFGETIEKYFKDDGLWLLAEECWTPGTANDALRYMGNPNRGNQPDTYGGTLWADPTNTGDGDFGGVHTNSGVANFAFFLLVNGGSGINDPPFSNRYSVSGISIVSARRIFYKALADYLTWSSNFNHARTATEQAAIDLFGSLSPELAQLQRAWYAVGVGAPPNVPPTITAFTPASGPAGTQVTITGTNFFLGQPQVFFNGATATNLIIDSNTQIRATVPATTTGKISVTTAGGTGLSAADFTVIQSPFISSFDPGFGTPGTAVTITGTNFTGAWSVAFNGIPDPGFIFDSDTQIRATVPAGATTGRISISNAAGTGTSGLDFIVFLPAITINDVSVTEGNVPQGGMNAVFTVSLSAGTGEVVTVNYMTANGTATAGSDYEAVPSGTLTFSAWTTSQTITVPVLGDLLFELNETFFVNLSGETNATIADGQGQGTINDDDSPAVSINDMSLAEGNSGTANVNFTLTLAPASNQDVFVSYNTTEGTATVNSDYWASSGTVVLPAGTTELTIPVIILGDVLVEPNETFFVNLTSATNANIADGQGQGTIINDDASSSPFTDINAGLTGVHWSAVAWGDYDNDGDLDILLTGNNNFTSSIAKVYRNTGGVFAVDPAVVLPGVYNSSVAWGDYNNDGHLDILIVGNTGAGLIARVYKNNGNGSSFTDLNAGLPGVDFGSAAWGDYDNDGDLDILLTGDLGSVNRITRVYKNNGNDTFTDISATALPGVTYSAVAWGDYDNDGDLDILLTGKQNSGQDLARVYRNDLGSFVDSGISLQAVSLSSAAWGDYDNDGDLDIVLMGHIGTGFVSKVYQNNGGSFTDIAAALTGVNYGSVAWGDYDNDGKLDILLTGSTGSQISKVYRNNGSSSFTDISAGLTGVSSGSATSSAWGDYDNDGKLDILLTGYSSTTNSSISKVYRNNSTTANTTPAAPTNLTATVSGSSVTFSWSKATDGQTPQDGLTYNLRLGTSTSGVQKVSPMANVSTGYRRLPALGNTNHRASWTIKNLPTGTFFWSAQAIDHAFAGSAFAGELSFTIGGGPCTNIALNKTATASNSSGSNTPNKAVDGSTSTYWRSSSGGTQWWQVDLSTGTLSYNQFTIKWRSNRHAKDYKIRVSNNANFTTFTNVYTRTNGAGGTETITLTGAPRTERYVRLHMTKVNSSYYGVNEFEVCGFSSVALTKNSTGDDEEMAAAIPTAIALQQNYPNPFNPQTTIAYDLPEATQMRLVIYDMLGQVVRTLVDETQSAGSKRVIWDGRNEFGKQVSTGVYLYQLQVGRQQLVRRMVLQR